MSDGACNVEGAADRAIIVVIELRKLSAFESPQLHQENLDSRYANQVRDLPLEARRVRTSCVPQLRTRPQRFFLEAGRMRVAARGAISVPLHSAAATAPYVHARERVPVRAKARLAP